MSTAFYDLLFQFYGLRENPFHVSPDPRFYFSTRALDSAFAELLFGIDTRQGLLLLTGEAGTGKTTLLHQILDRLEHQGRPSAYVFHTSLGPQELFEFVLRDFGISCSSRSKGDLVSTLHAWLTKPIVCDQMPVLIVDEAQVLSQKALDELRLLLNLENPHGKMLQIILAGQPELEEKLRRPELRQLRQRVMFHSRIPLLTAKETSDYIAFRVASAGADGAALFPPETIDLIHEASRGIARIVNLLCEHALISAYADQRREVSPEIVCRIAAEFDFPVVPLATDSFGSSSVMSHFSPQVADQPTPAPEPPLTPRSEVSPPRTERVVPIPLVSEAPVVVISPLTTPAVTVHSAVVPPAVAIPISSSSDKIPHYRRGHHWYVMGLRYRRFRNWKSQFMGYWRDVTRSLIRDWGVTLHAVSLPTRALLPDSVPNDFRWRGLLRPIQEWLCEPLVWSGVHHVVVDWLCQPSARPGNYSTRRPTR